VYFAVVEGRHAAKVRKALHLPTREFHITLGFPYLPTRFLPKGDIHGVGKGSSTLLRQQAVTLTKV